MHRCCVRRNRFDVAARSDGVLYRGIAGAAAPSLVMLAVGLPPDGASARVTTGTRDQPWCLGVWCDESRHPLGEVAVVTVVVGRGRGRGRATSPFVRRCLHSWLPETRYASLCGDLLVLQQPTGRRVSGDWGVRNVRPRLRHGNVYVHVHPSSAVGEYLRLGTQTPAARRDLAALVAGYSPSIVLERAAKPA